MELKKSFSALMVVGLLATLAMGISATPVQAATPGYPASKYIKDTSVANPRNPLDYGTGGVRILLTSKGDFRGQFSCFYYAWKMAGWTIESWESQTGKEWPYHWRSKASVALEISFHCMRYDTTKRITTIGFNEWYWD